MTPEKLTAIEAKYAKDNSLGADDVRELCAALRARDAVIGKVATGVEALRKEREEKWEPRIARLEKRLALAEAVCEAAEEYAEDTTMNLGLSRTKRALEAWRKGRET